MKVLKYSFFILIIIIFAYSITKSSNKNIRIITEDAENIKELEWEDIVNFIEKFKSISNSSHNSSKNNNLEYFKTKLLKSPYGSCYITRVINNEGRCMGIQTLTKKS